MKNYEEKLKLAKEALESGSYDKETIEYIFPELKESEEEKWRNWLIGHLKGYINQTDNEYVEVCKKAIAWLEKQGKQKPADRVEPKFKSGDWIVYKDDYTKEEDVLEVSNPDSKGTSLYTTDGHQKYYLSWESLKKARLWTIQDAKDGDVLATEWNQDNDIWEKILIFKALNDNGVEGYGNTFKNKDLFFIDEKVPYYSKTWSKYLCPATKEQRDLLFSKMKEAGYEWDAEKKVEED